MRPFRTCAPPCKPIRKFPTPMTTLPSPMGARRPRRCRPRSAQAAFNRGNLPTARQLAGRAKGRFPVGSPGWVKAATSRASGRRSSAAFYNDFQRGLSPMTPITIRLALAAAAVWLMLAPTLPAAAQEFSSRRKARSNASSRTISSAIPKCSRGDRRARQAPGRRRYRKGQGRRRRQCRSAVQFEPPVVLGNAKGDVTMVEFFDYNCGFCKRALADMMELLKDDAKLRIVLKEFPVLGPGSVEAAKVAVAVRMQDKAGKKYPRFPSEASRRPRPGRQGPRARGRQGSRHGHVQARQGPGERGDQGLDR